MAGVVNDIEALAEFRAHLMRFDHDLAENFATIQGHWRELGEIWRDDMYRLFGEALDEVTPGSASLSAGESTRSTARRPKNPRPARRRARSAVA